MKFLKSKLFFIKHILSETLHFYFNSFFQKFFRKFLSELFQLHISSFRFEINCMLLFHIIPYYLITSLRQLHLSIYTIITVYYYALILLHEDYLYILYYSNYFFKIIFGLWNQKFSITSLFYNIHQCLPLPQSKPRYYLVEVTFSETSYIRE